MQLRTRCHARVLGGSFMRCSSGRGAILAFSAARCYPRNPAAVLRGAAPAGHYPSSSLPRCSSGRVLPMQPSSSFTRCSSGQALPQQQFNEVLNSDGGAPLQAKGEGSRLLLSGLDGRGGRGDRQRRRSAGGVQVATNGLDGCAGGAQGS